jgi:hypothetical protein
MLQFRAYHTLLCQLQLDLWVFLQLHVCEKLCVSSFSQGYKWKTTTYIILKICSFSDLPWYFKSINKIGDGRVFSFVHLTWNDPHTYANGMNECNRIQAHWSVMFWCSIPLRTVNNQTWERFSQAKQYIIKLYNFLKILISFILRHVVTIELTSGFFLNT